MADDFLECNGWIDQKSCSPDVRSPNDSSHMTSSCDTLIIGDRSGYCLCHNGGIRIPQRCHHDPIRCYEVCAAASTRIVHAPLFLEVFMWTVLTVIMLWVCYNMSMAIFEMLSRYFECCRSLRRWDGIIKCGECRIPITWSGWKKWKQIREINALECRRFKSFSELEHDLISDGSGSCIICFEHYEAKSKVLRLDCGHHFHKKCAMQWLLTNRMCPICRQDFQSAENQHTKRSGVESELIENVEMMDIELQAERAVHIEEYQDFKSDDEDEVDHQDISQNHEYVQMNSTVDLDA